MDKAINAYDYMRIQDVDAFRAAAKHFKVWILVRASNIEAKKYIGVHGFVPKRLDCKAKAADRNARIPGVRGEKQTAGLVVNPLLEGMETAFAGGRKYQRAIEFWHKFEDHCYLPKPGPRLPYFPGGKFYSVQMDRSHPHYGCVMFSSWSNAASGQYIHSDYDLYGIVREADPRSNVRVNEQRLGQVHSRGQDLFDVQHFLNKRMGLAMILHGEQEKYSDDTNDKLDVFWPDGVRLTQAYGSDAIRRLYDTFQGRQLFGPDAMPRPLAGKWEIAPGEFLSPSRIGG